MKKILSKKLKEPLPAVKESLDKLKPLVEAENQIVKFQHGISTSNYTEFYTETQGLDIVRKYFFENSMAQAQIDSFDDFVYFRLQEIIDQEPPIEVELSDTQRYQIKFGAVYIDNPCIIENKETRPLFPMEARIRNLTYASNVSCDVTVTVYEGKTTTETQHNKFPLAKLPIMLKSSKCHLYKKDKSECINYAECINDHGGYFIINGNERVLVSQLKSDCNRINVTMEKGINKAKKTEKKSNKQNTKIIKKYLYCAYIRSMSSETNHSVLTTVKLCSDNKTIVATIPNITEIIPVGIVFKAMGIQQDDILSYINMGDYTDEAKVYLSSILRQSYGINTIDDALEYMGQYCRHTLVKEEKKKYVKQIVDKEIYPHLGITITSHDNALFLGYMIKKLLLTVLKKRSVDNIDNYSNKRLEISGILIHDLFKTLYKRFLSDLQEKLDKRKHLPNLSTIKPTITAGLMYCFTTSNWGPKGAYMIQGVSQIAERTTGMSILTHVRRVNIPVGKKVKNDAIRQIQPSQVGYICLAESPEGKSAGIVINMTVFSRVSKRIAPLLVKKIIKKCKHYIPLESKLNLLNSTYILLNGIVIGITHNPSNFVSFLRIQRNNNTIDKDVSISYDTVDNEIKIWCTEGRLLRPLLVVKNKDKPIDLPKEFTWASLVKNNYIVYLDPNEIEENVIAMYPKSMGSHGSHVYSYCEIHPISLLGIMASMIVFSDHSQSPRNIYQTNMGKQALGMVTNFSVRADTRLYVLNYGQRPLVDTIVAQCINPTPSGQNVIVAIGCFTGFNQEDSIILNQSSVDRGMFWVTQYKTFEDMEKKNDNNIERICIPPENNTNVNENDPTYFKRKMANYSLLDSRGVIYARHPVKINDRIAHFPVYVKRGDVLVGKISIKTVKGVEIRTDISRVATEDEEGVVDHVYYTTTLTGNILIKIVIRTQKIPTVGDKFASCCAQKGTVGMMYTKENLPYTMTGLTPDIIINPHCLPSRMTISMLIEAVLGKYCAYSCTHGDGTPFTDKSHDVEAIVNEFFNHCKKNNIGISPYGKETMYSPFTGEAYEEQIFICPVYYQRLKHMVSDKVHARARGRRNIANRAPVQGRARAGGLRIGPVKKTVPKWKKILQSEFQTRFKTLAGLYKWKSGKMLIILIIKICTKCQH